MIPLNEVPRVIKCIETGSRIAVQGQWERENGELLFLGYSVSDLQDEKSLKMDSVNGCKTL